MIDASSAEGISGSVDVTGPRVDLNGRLVALAGDLRGAAALYLAEREIEMKPDQADPLLRVGLPLADVQASQCR